MKALPMGRAPRSWIIKGSQDGTHWTMLDERRDDMSLGVPNVEQQFTIQNISASTVRFIELQLTGPNHGNRHGINLAYFDLSGSWVE
jgi:hypothetical protein